MRRPSIPGKFASKDPQTLADFRRVQASWQELLDWLIAGGAGGSGDGTIAFSKNGTLVASEPGLNLVEGTNVTITVTDAPGSSRVNATFDVASAAPSGAAGGGLSGTYPNPTVVMTSNAPIDVTVAAAAVGTGTAPARDDHKHNITTGTPSTLVVGGSNSAGSASSVSKSDHLHALPAFGTTSGTFCEGNDPRLKYFASEFWAPPDTANANDQEFASSSLPAYTLYDINTTTPSVVSPDSGISILSQPAAGHCRVEANKTNRRSWLLVQPRGENRWWFYGVKINLAGTNGWVIRTRIMSSIRLGSGTNNAADFGLCILSDNSGAPKISAAGVPDQGIIMGWESDTNTMAIEIDSVAAGVLTSVATGSDLDATFTSTDLEMVAALQSGSGSGTWDLFVRSQTLTIYLGTVAPGTSLKQGVDVWVGWRFNGIDSNMPTSPIMGADYLRFETTEADLLP